VKPHYEQTLADLRSARDRLTDLIDTLEGFANAADSEAPVVATESTSSPPTPAEPQAEPPKRRGRQPKPHKAAAAPREGKSIRDSIRPLIAKIKSPFTMKGLKAVAREKLGEQWDDRQITNGCDQTARAKVENRELEKIEDKPPTFARGGASTGRAVGDEASDESVTVSTETKRRGRPPKQGRGAQTVAPDKFEANKIASELIRAAITKSSEPFTQPGLVEAIADKVPDGINPLLAIRNALNRYVQLDYVREINGGYKRSPSWSQI
jgi:hypothetical protein